jgi:hypothetical protein
MPLLMAKDKTVYLQLEVPEDLRTQLKIEALKQGLTLRDFAVSLLDEGLKKQQEQSK